MNADHLRALAEELGLDAVGVARAEAYTETERHIRERRARGLFADMRFTMAQPERSCHPETLLEDARSVVSAALCYWEPEPPLGAGEGRLARYTWHDGYAQLRERLARLGDLIGGRYRVLVDANQHVDREAAARSGVGFYGKNTMLITRRHGSWVVLGTLVTAVELEATRPLDADCGECRICIDACPTGALDEPGVLDSAKCLSYWTQAPAPIPEAYRPALGAQVYGCDICQDVCPWNNFAQVAPEREFYARDGNLTPSLIALLGMTRDEFNHRFKGSPVKRAKHTGFLRNVAVALGNSNDPAAIPALERALEHEEPLVRAHAAWALGRLGARAVLERRRPVESAVEVLEEIDAALAAS